MFSDLAADFCTENSLKGVRVETKRYGEITERKVEIFTRQGAEILGKPCGKYFSVEVPFGTLPTLPLTLRLQNLFFQQVVKNISKGERLLIVGFGNGNLACDALGNLVLNRLITGKGEREIITLKAGVEGVTGLQSTRHVSAVVKEISPCAVLCIDALVGAEFSRIGSVFQLTDAGLAPGSGTGIRTQAVNKNTLGVPVFSVGVPLAVPYFLGEEKGEKYVVCPREIDLTVRRVAQVLGDALNLAFHPNLSLRDLALAPISFF